MEKEFRYDAFISYRHVEPDRSHAKWLHKALETYRVPHSIAKANKSKGLPYNISRVFRDEDELPASADLSSEITKALDESRYLIVICSPRIVSSVWCDAEVKRFRELGRHDKIIALLTEGEPHESFLPSLCEIRKEIVKEDGSTIEEIETIEPLAADIRPRSDISIKDSKYLAKLRILSTMLGCKFDDLRRRELKRRQKRMAVALSTALVLLVTFAIIAIWALNAQRIAEEQRSIAIEKSFEAQKQKTIAEKQRDVAEDSAYRANMLLAKSAYEDKDPHNGEKFLLNCPPQLRNWPWKYLWKRNHQYSKKILGHTMEITKVLLSPDGTTLVSIGKGRDLYIWNTKSCKLVHRVHEKLIGKKDFCFSSDGKYIFYTSHDFSIKVIETQNYRVIHTLKGHKKRIVKIDLSQNDKKLASLSLDNSIKIWDLKEFKLKKSISIDSKTVNSLSFLPSLPVIVTSTSKGLIEKFNILNGNSIQKVKLKDPIISLNIHPFKKQLYVGHVNGLLSVRHSLSLKEIHKQKDLYNNILDVRFSKDGRRAIMGTYFGEIKVFNTDALKTEFTLRGHTKFINSIEISTDGNTLYSAGKDKIIHLWNLNTHQKPFLSHNSPIFYFAHYVPNSNFIVSGDKNNQLILWNRSTRRPEVIKKVKMGHKAAISPNGKLLAVLNTENGHNKLEVRDSNSLDLLKNLTPPVKKVNNLKFSSDSLNLICSTPSKYIFIWEIKTGKGVKVLKEAKNSTYTTAVSTDGKYITSGTTELNIWDGQNYNLLKSFRPHVRGVYAIAFSPDNKLLATGGLDNIIKLWDLNTFSLISTFEGHDHIITALTFSPDSKMLVSGNRSSEIKIWDLQTKKEIPCYFETHNIYGVNNLHTISFAPNGKQFITTGNDNKIRIWDADPTVDSNKITDNAVQYSQKIIDEIQTNGSVELIRDLILLADLSYKDAENKTILDYAKMHNSAKVIELLQSTGAFK